MANALLDIVQNQAAENDRLRAENKALRARDTLVDADFVEPAKRSRTETRKRRAGQLKSWTPARVEKASERMKALWRFRQMEVATNPNESFYRNGETS